MKRYWLATVLPFLMVLAACGTITTSTTECEDGLCVKADYTCDNARGKRVSVNLQATSTNSPPIPVKFVVRTVDAYIKSEKGEVGKKQDSPETVSLGMILPAHDKETYKILVYRDGNEEDEVFTVYLEPNEDCQDDDSPLQPTTQPQGK